MEAGESGYAFATLWREATKAVGYIKDAIIGTSAQREQGDVARMGDRAKYRAAMVSAGKITIPVIIIAILIVFLIRKSK